VRVHRGLEALVGLRAHDLVWEVAANSQNRTDVTNSGIVVVPDSTIQATIVLRRR
jgi:hypothetical protein